MSLSANYLYLYLGDTIIPYIYFIFMLIFLIPFFILISFQLLQLIKFEFYLNHLNKIDFDTYSLDQLFNLLKVLLKKKQWLNAINLMESKKNISIENMHKYFNAVGYIYDNMNEYNLASLYYLKSLSFKENYIIGLQNLAKIYEKKKNYALALSTYQIILKYDSSNISANEYLEKRNF